MKHYPQYFIVATLLFAGILAARPAFAGPAEKLIITGTGADIGTMRLIAASFQKKHPSVAVNVLPSTGSTGAIRAVSEGKIDIGLSCRPLKKEERGAGITEEPYSRTAFLFGVQATNPTKNLTLAEIEEIYAGKRKTWSDGTPIRLILRPLSDFFSIYLAGINPGLKSAAENAHAVPGVFVGNTDQEAARQMEKTPGSFGVTSSALVAAEKRKIKALSVDGIAPTNANVSAGTYPYALTMYLVYKDKAKGATKDFREFVFSRDGQKFLANTGHVNLARITGK